MRLADRCSPMHRVVKDKQTQQANGQAFVEFANAPAAQAAADASAQAR